MLARVIAATILVAVTAALPNNLQAAYSSNTLIQHVNVFVISDDTGMCPAGLIKKGMALPDPSGNKLYFPKSYNVTCIDVPSKKNVNTFQYIEKVVVPKMAKATQKAANIEELYIFVYQPPIEKQFQDYIAARFGTKIALMVDGWANVSANTAFAPIWAATIFHEGRHLAIHGTWHDSKGNLLPNNQIWRYSG